MIEVPIPKDITKVKTTLIGPFSTRMVVCGLIAAAVDFAALTLVNAIMPGLSLNTKIGIGVILAVPIMAFAVVTPYDMPLEKFLKNAFVLNYIAPKVRTYQIENFYNSQEEEAEKEKTEKNFKQKVFSASVLRKHPDYVMYQ